MHGAHAVGQAIAQLERAVFIEKLVGRESGAGDGDDLVVIVAPGGRRWPIRSLFPSHDKPRTEAFNAVARMYNIRKLHAIIRAARCGCGTSLRQGRSGPKEQNIRRNESGGASSRPRASTVSSVVRGSSRTRWLPLIHSRPISITLEFRSSRIFIRRPSQIADGDDSFRLVGTSLLRPSSNGPTRAE